MLSQHAEGLTLSEIARQMSVHERTIRRDLRLFVAAGIPLRETVCRGNKKIWRIDQRGTLLSTNGTGDEVLALKVVENLLSTLGGSALQAAIRDCRERISASLSPGERPAHRTADGITAVRA